MGRLVKAVEGLDLLYALGVHPLVATVGQATALAATAHAGLGLGQILLDRATGHELHDHEGQQQYARSEEHTSELQSHLNLVCRLLLEKKKIHTPIRAISVTAPCSLQD